MPNTATAAPRMTEAHVDALKYQQAVADETGDPVEAELGEIASLISDLVSGKRDTFDTETEVKVSRKELSDLDTQLRLAPPMNYPALRMIRRWLSDTETRR